MREERGFECNASEIIEVAYDLQTRSHIAAMKTAETADLDEIHTSAMAETILSLCEPATISRFGHSVASDRPVRRPHIVRLRPHVLCGITSATGARSVVTPVGGSLTTVPVLPLLRLKLPAV